MLKEYLPSILQRVRPWLSEQDIDAGTRGVREIAKQLEVTHVGIVCLNAENQEAPWILFEAGAISKFVETSRAIVLRIGMTITDVKKGPLSEFQSVGTDSDGILKLVKSINLSFPIDEQLETAILERSFEGQWPSLKNALDSALATPSTPAKVKRDTDEMIEEILTLVRQQSQAQQVTTPDPKESTGKFSYQLSALEGFAQLLALSGKPVPQPGAATRALQAAIRGGVEAEYVPNEIELD